MKQYRHELKFEITRTMATILMGRLKLIMDVDKNFYNKDGSYIIRSLYFDDYDNNAYYEKVNGVLHRKKYRIRTYNYSTSPIKLECKEKEDNLSLKRTTSLSMETYQAIMNKQLDQIDTTDPLLLEFVNKIRYRGLRPSIMVDYKRIAFTYHVSEVRVTFDYHINSGYNNYDIFNKDTPNISILDDKTLVMEVKYNEILPHEIALVLGSIPTTKEAFSKFGYCRSVKE